MLVVANAGSCLNCMQSVAITYLLLGVSSLAHTNKLQGIYS